MAEQEYSSDFAASCELRVSSRANVLRRADGVRGGACCARMTDCIKACPTQRTDSCIHDCATGGENAPGATELGVVANCSKNKATYAADASCSFDKCALGEPRDGC